MHIPATAIPRRFVLFALRFPRREGMRRREGSKEGNVFLEVLRSRLKLHLQLSFEKVLKSKARNLTEKTFSLWKSFE